MGLFSKIIEVGKTLMENPSAVDETLEKASNLKQNAERIIDVVQEKRIENAQFTAAKFLNKLKNIEKQVDVNYLKAQGKNYEDKIRYDAEHAMNYTYSVPCKYEAMFRTGDYFAVCIDDKFGLINKNDKDVIKFKYGYLDCSNNGFILLERNGKYGYMNFDEEILIEPYYEDAGVYVDGVAYAAVNTESGIKYGYIDISGQFIIEPQFDYAEDFHSNGLAVVGKVDNYGSIGKGVIDKNGKLVVACKHEVLKMHQSEIEYATESWHNPSFLDLNGNPNGHEEKYGYDSYPSDPLNKIIPYNTSQLKYGYYTHTEHGDFGNIEPVFDEAYSFDKNGYAIVKRDGLYGVISLNK